MATQVTDYKCPSCTGPLRFDSDTQGLVCDYCDSHYSVAEIEAIYAVADEQAAAEFKKEEKEAAWKTEELKDWDLTPEGMKAYSCPSCGAELICDETTASTSCPYCGNATIVPGQMDGALKPDYILPFKLDKAAAVAALNQFYRKKFFLPKAFTANNRVAKVQGVYVPFWLFDGVADADISYHATRSMTNRQGDYMVTNTDHFHVRRSGTVAFTQIPVDGSSKMPDDFMDSIEPFHYNELKDYSNAYLPGFLADKYDVSAEDSSHRANQRMIRSAKEAMREDVSGYEMVNETSSKVEILPGEVHYALLPVWMLHTKWGEKNYLFAMNGQTGKLVGDLPVDWAKFWGTFAGLTAAFGVLLTVSGVGQFLAQLFSSLF